MLKREASEKLYQRMGYDRNVSIVCEWHNKWTAADGRHGALSLPGSSGSGIWSLDQDGNPALAGIFTEVTGKDKSQGARVFAGTRAHIHLKSMDELFVAPASAGIK